MERAFIPRLIDEVLNTVGDDFKQNNDTITNDMLRMLYGIFDKVLRGAFELIESNSVTIMQINSCFTKTDQFLFQNDAPKDILTKYFELAGSNNVTYVIFNRVNYCQCKFYQQRILTSKSYPVCKHFLAAHLAYAWNKCRKYTIDFDMYTDLVKNVSNSE